MAATRKRGRKIRVALTAACGILGLSGPAAQATEVTTAVMAYSEPDRVSCFEAVADGNHTFGDGKTANFHLVYDALSGPSANGAVPSSGTQVFTSPSGKGSYTVDAGTTPLDPTFHDARVAVSGGGAMPVGRLGSWSAGLYGSAEHDYTSLGVNTGLTRDFNKRNTTLVVRGAYFHDTINPEGGRPLPLAEMPPRDSALPRLEGNGTKQVLDLGIGLTQVLDPKTLVYLNYTYSGVKGYQTDPYKILSRVDGTTGDPVDYLYESRPDRRGKNVVFGRLSRSLGGDVLQLTYRFMHDDWAITSHTVEGRYRWNVGDRSYLQPHVRWYTQSAADFYRRYLTDDAPLPDQATADYRLGAMDTWTLGLKYGRMMSDENELTVSLSYYLQTGESHPADAIGVLRNYDLFPDVTAVYLQVGYTFGAL